MQRYNPHAIENQARLWPFSPGCGQLPDDLKQRSELMFCHDCAIVPDIFSLSMKIPPDEAVEFGLDACRTALISSQNAEKVSIELLESAYKWLNNFYNSFYKCSNGFSAQCWLETALQAKDHIVVRQNYHAGLALVRKAFKTSPPGSDISENEKMLVLATTHAFAPLTTCNLAGYPERGFTNIKSLIECFPELIPVRFAMQKGGWHWKVFNRKLYNQDPVAQFRQLKMIRTATGARPLKLVKTEEGTRICFY